MDAKTSDPTRTGAVWVTATGSFLLFAAAVAFVTVRWDQIPDGMKLGALAMLTGGLLVAGRPGSALAGRHAPAAASVLFHLGAFLVPVTTAAVLLHLEVPRDVQLLVLGAGAAALFWALQRFERSVVLGWASVAAVVVATVGLGGLVPVPAAAALTVLGAGALAAGRLRIATAWAGLAAVVPLAAVLIEGADEVGGPGWLLEAVAGRGLTPAAVGLAAGAVLVVLTHRLRALPLLGLAAASLGSGVAIAHAQLQPEAPALLLAGGAAFVLAELAALGWRRDPFWREPLHLLAQTGEAIALLGVPVAVGATALLPLHVLDREPVAAAAFALAAIGWLLADLRRAEGTDAWPALGLLFGGGWSLGTAAAAASAVGAAALASAAVLPTALAALAAAGLLVLSGRAVALPLVPLLAAGAAALVGEDPEVALAVGAAGSLLVAFQATLHEADQAEPLALASLAPAGIGLAFLWPGHPTAALLLGLGLAGVLAVVLDRATCGRALGWAPRLGATVLLLGLVDRPAEDVVVVAGTYVLLATLEGLRRDDPWPLVGWAFGVPPLLSGVTALGGLSLPESAVVLASCAAPFAAAGHRWPVVRLPLVATAASLAASGLAVGATDPGVLGTVLILDGALAVAFGLLTGRPAVLGAGGVLAVIGTWTHLSLGEVEALDAYALPVAIVLWLVATRVADETVSSWITHAPAVALAGGTALAERIGGGPGEHAVLAGGVALLAVVEGGGRRRAAPLLLGTGLLVALTVHETTAVTAGVPTWAWLAAGGTLLVGAGLAMEHHQLGPVETGRRLVDVVHQNFR